MNEFLLVIFLGFNTPLWVKASQKIGNKSLPLLILSFSICQTLIFSPLVHLMEVEISAPFCVLFTSYWCTIIIIHQAASELWAWCWWVNECSEVHMNSILNRILLQLRLLILFFASKYRGHSSEKKTIHIFLKDRNNCTYYLQFLNSLRSKIIFKRKPLED